MKKGSLNGSIHDDYGTIQEVELEGAKNPLNTFEARQSAFVYTPFSSLHPSRTFHHCVIYVLTHVELATLPLFPVLSYLRMQQQRNAHLLDTHETIPNIFSKAALPSDLVSLLEGFCHVTEKLFPHIFLGLFLHDVITFYTQVDNRYGTTLKDILFGTASNSLAWSGIYGTDMALETLDWLIPSTIGLALTVSALSQLIYDRYRLNSGKATMDAINTETSLRFLRHIVLWNSNADSRFLALERLSKLSHSAGSFMQRFRALSMIEQIASSFQPNFTHDTESLYGVAFNALNQRADNPEDRFFQHYARYLRWSLGEEPNHKSNLFLVPFTAITVAILFAKMRLLEMLWHKVKERADYNAAKKSCDAENKVYTLTQSGKIECTVCGDWPNMYYGDIQTSQACLTGLFAKTQGPSFIINKLSSLQERLNRYADFSVVDLSKQDLATAWSEPEWDQILSLLEAIPNLHLTIFNLSTLSLSSLRFSDQKMQRLAKSIKQLPIECLDLTRQNLSGDNANVLFSSLANNTVLNDLRFSDTASGNAVACALATILPATRISTLMTGNNNVSDAGMDCYTKVLPMTEVNSFYAPANPMTENGLLPFVQNLNKTKIRHLDISVIKLSPVTVDALGQQLIFLTSLNLAQCGLSDQHISHWATYVSNAATETYDLSDNHLLTGASIIPFLSAQPDNLRLVINLAGLVKLSINDYQQIGQLLSFKKIVSLDMSRTDAKCVGFLSVMANSSQLHTLIVSDNAINDACIPTFIQSLTAQTHSLQYLDLSANRISSSGVSQLLARMSETQLRVLHLANNQLTGVEFSDYPLAIAKSHLIELNLSRNPISTRWLSQLLNALLINTSLQKLDLSGITLSEDNGLLLAQHLLPSIPHADSLSDITLTRDQQRWLHDIQLSRFRETAITELSVSATHIGDKGVRALCHAAPVAHLFMLELSGNLMNSPIENIHHCSEMGMPPSSMVMQPLSTFSNANSAHAACLAPTVLLAGTLLAWSLKKILSMWTRNSCSIGANKDIEISVALCHIPSG